MPHYLTSIGNTIGSIAGKISGLCKSVAGIFKKEFAGDIKAGAAEAGGILETLVGGTVAAPLTLSQFFIIKNAAKAIAASTPITIPAGLVITPMMPPKFAIVFVIVPNIRCAVPTAVTTFPKTRTPKQWQSCLDQQRR